MAYQQLTLRMIRLLVALNQGERLVHTTGVGYEWPDRPRTHYPHLPERAHWGTVVALCKRDLIRPIKIKTGTEYHLTAAGQVYLNTRDRAHAQDHE